MCCSRRKEATQRGGARTRNALKKTVDETRVTRDKVLN
jgi:hypothetical protein